MKVGAGTDRLLLNPRAFSIGMALFKNPSAKGALDKSPDPETAIFLTALAFGLAMLSLLAVLALAGVMELAEILPLFAVPLLLLIASAPSFRRWMESEAVEAAVQEDAYLSSQQSLPNLRRDSLDAEPAAMTRR
jgi:hypothetical protein